MSNPVAINSVWGGSDKARRERIAKYRKKIIEEEEEAVQLKEERERRLKARILCLALEGRQRHIQSRKRLYLTRAALMSGPNGSQIPLKGIEYANPWQKLYNSRDAKAYIVTMGVDPQVFDKILSSSFHKAFDTNPMPRYLYTTSNPSKLAAYEVRIYRRCVDAMGCLGLILHFLNSSGTQQTLQQIFALTPAVCSRYIRYGLELLVHALRNMKEAAMSWPGQNIELLKEYESLIVQKHSSLLKGAFGFVDGLHLPIQTSSDMATQNAFYNGWVHAHFTSNIFVFSPKGEISSATINALGSHHDSQVARQLFQQLYHKTIEGYWLLADSRFPHQGIVAGKIRVPLKNDCKLPTNPAEHALVIKRNTQHVSVRQPAEWGMRALQGSFGRLRVPMPCDDKEYRKYLLEACSRVHQLRVRLLGINQIKTVYGKIWTDEDIIYDTFRRMVFGQIQQHDRISRNYKFS